MKNIKIFPLREIANWQLKSPEGPEKSWVQVPSLQRGLVWNAAQAEVLWDSLMRGIPIGTFSLIAAQKIQNQKKSVCTLPDNWDYSNTFWLLDGQQRANTIAMGYRPFKNTDEDKDKPILWIDLKPKKQNGNRKFAFRVTTPAHPWGYKISDADRKNKNNPLSASEIKNFSEDVDKELGTQLLGDLKNIKKPSIFDLWPAEATLPIPFSILMEVAKSISIKSIKAYIESEPRLKNSNWWKWFEEDFKDENLEERLKPIISALNLLEKTEAAGLVAPEDLAEKSSQDEDDDDSEIATYFLRMNKSGTEPSDEDINYSILKSIAPELSCIDELAKGKMGASRLAHLSMLAYNVNMKKEWSFSIKRQKVYQLAKDKTFIKYIGTPEESCFKSTLEQVDRWLIQDGHLLPVHQTYIAHERDGMVFLLLLLFALRQQSVATLDGKNVCAIATMASWFGEGSCKHLYEEFTKSDGDGLLRLRKGLYHAIHTGAFTIPPLPEDFDLPLKEEDKNKALDASRSFLDDPLRRVAIEKIRGWKSHGGKELLLYACRNFMNEVFEGYNPASSVHSEENTPWDYDHIFPKSWLISGQGNRQGSWHEIVEKYINSIGNIAPLPFQLNRGKGATPPCEYCDKDRPGSNEQLLIEIPDASLGFYSEDHGRELEKEVGKAYQFVSITAARFKNIYTKWYDDLGIAELLNFEALPKDDRQILFEKIKNEQPQARVYFVCDGGYQREVRCDADWARPWLAVGVVREEPQRELVGIASDGTHIEIGRRRHPEDNNIDQDTNKWWHDECDYRENACSPNDAKAGEIIEQLRKL